MSEFQQVRRGPLAPLCRTDSSSLGTQTVALGVTTPELVVNQRWTSQNSVAPARKRSWRQPLQGTCDWNGARKSFAQFAEEPRRHEGEGRRPQAPPASIVLGSGVRRNFQDGGGSSSGSAMPVGAPPPLEKLGLEQDTEMTNVPNEQQREPKRRKEQSTMPEAADSSSKSSSSSSESSTDTNMGLVDLCTTLLSNAEAQGPLQRRSWSLDLLMTDAQGRTWDFSKADCRARCRQMVENS